MFIFGLGGKEGKMLGRWVKPDEMDLEKGLIDEDEMKLTDGLITIGRSTHLDLILVGFGSRF